MKTFKLIFVLIITFFLPFIVFAENNDISIIDIDSKNSNILKIFLDKNIETNVSDITSDVKVFKDLDNKKISIDLENNKLVNLSLEKSLEPNTSYSLLSVYWAEWTIDFKLDDMSNWLEIWWDNSDWIEKLIISDPKNIEIYFTKSIESDSVDLKLLREYDIESLKINSENNKELDVYLKNELYDGSKYIVMIFSITTKEDLNYVISNSIYDFVTEGVSSEKVEVPLEDEETWENTWEIALNSAETPDTWAETWILILATLLLSNFIYFRKRILKN
jgi:hypothetical protein